MSRQTNGFFVESKKCPQTNVYDKMCGDDDDGDIIKEASTQINAHGINKS